MAEQVAAAAQGDTGTQQTTTQQQTAAPADWRGSLPDDVKADATIGKYANVEALARAHIHAQRLIGADKVPLPGKNATEKDWAYVWGRLGRPDAPEGYKFTPPEGSKTVIDETTVKAFGAEAHKLGLNTQQAAELYKWYSGLVDQGSAAQEKARGEERVKAEENLRREWGMAFDKKLDGAKRFMQEVFDKADIDAIDAKGYGNDPAFLRIMAKLAAATKEDTIDGKPVTNGALSPVEAQAKIDEIMRDPAYWDKKAIGRQSLVDEVQRLFKMKHPE